MNGSGRLNTDYIDVYWVHAWDFMTQVEAGHIRARLEFGLFVPRKPEWLCLTRLQQLSVSCLGVDFLNDAFNVATPYRKRQSRRRSAYEVGYEQSD